MNNRFFFLLGLVSIFFQSCGDNETAEAVPNVEFVSEAIKVEIAQVNVGPFSTEINSNGKLEAVRKTDLKFESDGLIKKIFVTNGMSVGRGQAIASQTTSHLVSETNKNNEALAKARLNMEDILLGFGHSLSDGAEIPEEILRMAEARAGIAEANNQITQTKKRIADANLRAPFSGVIANVSSTEGSLSSVSEKVCTLIDNSELLVSFFVLEHEYGFITKGDSVMLSPVAFHDKSYKGTIEYINPLVDENGLIEVKAKVQNKDAELIDGMNVEVTVKKTYDQLISVPKSALIERQNRDVVFTYENGKAVWNYVTKSFENNDSIVIDKGLEAGAKIIIAGNTNLAHDTKVELDY